MVLWQYAMEAEICLLVSKKSLEFLVELWLYEGGMHCMERHDTVHEE
jgi:hypothetical protein